eukprot:c25921_g1_i1.p1 GENE.c25921_g1_i1~~c25921_g1_i1.p1  ORF type:complete len:978 (-),score=139.68 c25921_g1_i1:68-3001(-)
MGAENILGMVRLAVALFAVCSLCFTQGREDFISTKPPPKVSMGGPINEKGLMPCDNECLCASPHKPHEPEATLVILNEVHLRWGKVTESMYCDAATELQMKLEGSDSWTTQYNGPASEFVVYKIPIDILVSFRIRERNCNSVGPYSDATTIRTPSDTTRPLAPVLSTKTDSEICVKWEAHEDAVVILSIREVPEDPASMSPSWEDVFQGAATEGCATKLSAGTFYELRTTTQDPSLEEPTSSSVVLKTSIAAPPVPTKPFLVDSTDTMLSFQWSKPPSKDNRSPVALYSVEVAQVASVDDVTLSKEPAPVADQPHLAFFRVAQVSKAAGSVKGLKPGRMYAIRVKAVNEAGESAPSEVLMVETKPAAPGAVQGIHFASATSDTVRIEWEGADANGSPITAYEVSMSPGGALADFSEVYNGPKTHARVTGLQRLAYYGFRVRAVNAINKGPWSAQCNLKTPDAEKVLTTEELLTASNPMQAAAQAQALAQAQASSTARQDAIIGSQLHLQLQSTLKPQVLPTRDEPDKESDDLTTDHITENDPLAPAPPPGEPPVDVFDGFCDPRKGCMQKDAAIEVTPPCPGECHATQGQGYCVNNGKCACATGWQGADCNTAQCPRVLECGSHGSCIAPNTCRCSPGFNSPTCVLYWTSSFHAAEAMALPDIVAAREKRIHSQNLTIVTNEDYPAPEGGVRTVSEPATVPFQAPPTHLKRRSRPSPSPHPIRKGSYVAIPASPNFDFNLSETFTITLWFRASSANERAGAKLLSHGPHKHGPGYGLGLLPGGQLYCGIGTGIEPFRASNVATAVTELTFADGRFHHVACRINGKRRLINVLVDGNEVALAQPFPFQAGRISYFGELDFSELLPPSPSAVDHPLVIGANFDFEDGHFDGEISDIRLWRIGRTYDEIRASMWAPLSIAVPHLAFHLPLSDCWNTNLRALMWVDGRAEAALYPNTLSDCQLLMHPIARPPVEEDNIKLA